MSDLDLPRTFATLFTIGAFATTLLLLVVVQLGRIAHAIEAALEVEQADPDSVTRS